MRIFKPSALVLLFGVSFVLTASCGGDDDDTTPSAGKGGGAGHAGAGGKAGRGGSSSGAGEAGMPAQTKGGSGGRGGSSQSGNAGEGASSASAGAAGTDVTSRGGSGGTSGTSATGGSSGSPEGGNPSGGAGMGGAGGDVQASHKQCGRTCETTADCPTQTFCQADLHRCIECNDNTDCIPVKSGGWGPCTTDDDCLTILGEACGDINGRGYCVPAYDAEAGCEDPQVHTTLTKFGTSDVLDACIVDSGRCEDHVCFTTCASDPNFCTTASTGYGETCDEGSGRCTCESDDECTHGPSHCDPATHHCVECSETAQCPGAIVGKDTCVEGRCGCSSVDVCTTLAPGGSAVCE